MELTPTQQDQLLHLAAAHIRRALGSTGTEIPEFDDPRFDVPAGCFVSLHHSESHRLRGCIGLVRAEQPLRDAVADMASAVLRDTRFSDNPVSLDELPELELEISILGSFEAAEHPLDFEPLGHGIYLSCAGRAGLFLPQVARDTGWTREQLLTRLCSEKMGLPADAWREAGVKLSRFRAYVLGPRRFTRIP